MNASARASPTTRGAVGRLAGVLAVVAAIVAVVATVVAPSGTVFAHAALMSVTPADGEVVETTPPNVTLVFNEPVSLTGGAVRVLDRDAVDVATGVESRGEEIIVSLPPQLPNGTYTVSIEVISADSHRIASATIFSIGEADATAPIVQPTAGEIPTGLRAGTSLLTAVAYGGALIALGLWWSRGFTVIAGRFAAVGALALVVALPSRIARVGGGLDSLRDGDFVIDSLTGPLGVSTLVAVVGLVAFAVLASSGRERADGPRQWAIGVAGLVGLAGFVLEGHTRTQQPRWAIVGSDLVHLVAGAVWIGGIVGLILRYRARRDPAALARDIRRFSDHALFAVVAVAASGIVMAWIILPTLQALTETGYGLALVTKLALVAVVLLLGAYNRFRLVPTVDAASESGGAGGRELSRIVRIELATLLIVIVATSVLVSRSPNTADAVGAGDGGAGPTTDDVGGPTTSTAGSTAPVGEPFVAELDLGATAGTVRVELAPPRVGEINVNVALADAAGTPFEPVEPPVVQFRHQAADIGPLSFTVSPIGNGDFLAFGDLPIAGEWELTVRVRVTDFDSASATTTLTIDG